MSQNQNHLIHLTWECKYYVVFPSRLRKTCSERNFLCHTLCHAAKHDCLGTLRRICNGAGYFSATEFAHRGMT